MLYPLSFQIEHPKIFSRTEHLCLGEVVWCIQNHHAGAAVQLRGERFVNEIGHLQASLIKADGIVYPSSKLLLEAVHKILNVGCSGLNGGMPVTDKAGELDRHRVEGNARIFN
jgi:hypothetical protein